MAPYTTDVIEERPVPLIDLAKTETFEIGDSHPITSSVQWEIEKTRQVSPLLTRLTASTASGNEILATAAVAPNSSYHMNFSGPSLQCGQASTEKVAYRYASPASIIDQIHSSTSFALDKSGGSQGFPIYVAASPVPEMRRSPGQGGTANPDRTNFTNDCIVSVKGYTIMQDDVYGDALWIRHENESIACALQETNYRVMFETSGDTQKIIAVDHTLQRPIPSPSSSYLTITQSIVDLFTGAIGLVTHTAYNCDYAGSQDCHNVTSLVTYRTRIWSTVLIGALKLTAGATISTDPVSSLPDIPPEDRALTRNRSLGTLIEELSRNVTLSLYLSIPAS